MDTGMRIGRPCGHRRQQRGQDGQGDEMSRHVAIPACRRNQQRTAHAKQFLFFRSDACVISSANIALQVLHGCSTAQVRFSHYGTPQRHFRGVFHR
jgi:hypothetical protein